jgi:hypothetical protein
MSVWVGAQRAPTGKVGSLRATAHPALEQPAWEPELEPEREQLTRERVRMRADCLASVLARVELEPAAMELARLAVLQRAAQEPVWELVVAQELLQAELPTLAAAQSELESVSQK